MTVTKFLLSAATLSTLALTALSVPASADAMRTPSAALSGQAMARIAQPARAEAAAPLMQVADQMGAGSPMGLGHMSVMAGDLELTGAFSRATLPNAPVAGGFLTITNTGTEDDRLIGAESVAAGHMEVHEMAMEGDVMRMRELADGLPIPAGETVTLKPGGFHIMFMDLQQPLVEGETVPITLEFEKAGKVEVSLMIGAPNAKGAHAHGMN